jgi:2-oxoglutarate dehydrogenase E2 component (dihydrolipoamide succinyltransferase)
MSRLRSRVAERLVAAQRTAALLTTFNEVNMQPVNELRQRFKAEFEVRHGVKLGYMSFFVRAVCRALQQFPIVNAAIDGNDIVWNGDADIGIAISSPRGLVVPILRRAQTLSSAEIEAAIADFAQRARDTKLTLDDLSGGSFSITNGGVFGSLLSTPILNPPQSAILGMHAIQERPVAENGQVVIRPMMYLALTYDHRLIDGRDAVQFLVAVKAALEAPQDLLEGAQA